MARRPPSRRQVDGSKRQTTAATRRLRRLLISAVIVAVAVGGFLIATRSSGPKYTTFHDHAGGFSVTYPAGWIPYSTKNANIHLLAEVTTNSLDSISIAVEPTQAVVDTSNVQYLKAVTDAILSGSHPNVLQQDALTANGLFGYYYRYTFTDSQTGLTLIHFHYFVFQNHRMYSFVLQAVPADLAANGGRLAAQFDQVRASFHATA